MPHRYLMYLRKSRQDDPRETVEEVLSKHETILQEMATREFGGPIPEKNIYREVVSGERIDDRVEIKEVLSRIEDPAIEGVLVVEPSRLSRGDLGDCDKIIKSFQFTDTLIITQKMTYNLKSKMERKFFQHELLMGNDFLEYTKEILWRGRVAAAKRGCYISNQPPYGYNRIKLGKDWTLEPNDDADNVRLMFNWYVDEGLTPGKIAIRLNEMGVKTARDGEWSRDTVRSILVNPHYIGKILFNERKETPVIENGERITRYLRAPEDEIILTEGKHPAIISQEVFDAAQNRFKNNPRNKNDHDLVNVLAGILRCATCGNVMDLDPKKKHGGKARYKCRIRPGCHKSAKVTEVIDLLVYTLEANTLPMLEAKLENGDGDAAVIQRRRIEKLNKQMEDYRQQEDKQYELLETGVYNQETFERRNRGLRAKMEDTEKELHLARAAMPKNIDYGERITALKDAIAALKNPDLKNETKNRLLRSIIERIDYSAVDHGVGDTEIHLDVKLRLGRE